MAAEDDPEQRIRDLERSLSDRASELGTGSAAPSTPQYGYVDTPAPTYIPPQDSFPPPPEYSTYPPQPPAPGGYGAGYPPPLPGSYSSPPMTFGTPFQPSKTNGFRLGWVFLAIPVIGLVIAGIAFFAVFRAANDITSQFPSIDFPTNGVTAPTNGGSGPTVTEGGSVSIAGVSTKQTVACDGGSVNISGVSNTVEVTGHCTTVIVSGVENNVKIESADSISASGITNHVTFQSGAPETSATGDNVIEKG
jgi:hypothetical protein